MKMMKPTILASALLALAACSPSGDSATEGVDVPTPRNPFFGTWELTSARIAPWWDQQGEEPAPDPAFSKFTLAADNSSGPPILTCAKPQYATNIMPMRALFEGNLPDPAANAAELGFSASDVTVMSFSCAESAADVSLDFPMRDDKTILLGLDNVIYTFLRTST